MRPPPVPESDRAPIMNPAQGASVSELGRKKSLVRPERRRVNANDPNYYYRQHAQNMDVLPSTTGNDPILEEDEHRTISSDSSNLKPTEPQGVPTGGRTARVPSKREPLSKKRTTQGGKLQRKDTRPVLTDAEKQKQKEMDAAKPPSVWNIYCAIVTFWAPNPLLVCFGMPARAQRRAWREKIGLVSIILLVATFVGYLSTLR